MSMAIQRSKYTGDPGLGSFLKGVAQVGLGVAGMLPGVGGIARAAGGYLFPPAPGTTTYAQSPPMTRMPSTPTAGPGGIGGSDASFMQMVKTMSWGDIAARMGQPIATLQARRNRISQGITGGPGPCDPGSFRVGSKCVDILAAPLGGRPFISDPPGMNGMDMNGMMAGRPAVSGYHWNKAGYFLMSGEYVAPGTKMVKNRRRNPANPRATSNAITRIKGAKRYAKSLSSISIRKKC